MKEIIGFLNINKPTGYTSHDIVKILRNSTKIKKVGHSGTLDPFATGVLAVGINEATRLFEYLPSDKTYNAEFTFGIETDTNDITGEVTNKTDTTPCLEKITQKLSYFKGKIKQKPPIYSAIKIKGQRAYNLARKNKITLSDIEEKIVEIYSIDISSFKDRTLRLTIHCSAGTYIRSIARDLGNMLGTFCILSSLTRIKIGNNFIYDKSISPFIINESNIIEHLILPQSVLNLKQIKLSPEQIKLIHNGNSIKIQKDLVINHGQELQVIDNNNCLAAIGFLTNDYIIKPKKVLLKNAY